MSLGGTLLKVQEEITLLAEAGHCGSKADGALKYVRVDDIQEREREGVRKRGDGGEKRGAGEGRKIGTYVINQEMIKNNENADRSAAGFVGRRVEA